MATKWQLIEEIMERYESQGPQEVYACFVCESDKFACSYREFTSREKFVRHLGYHTKPELNEFINTMDRMEFEAIDERLMGYAH